MQTQQPSCYPKEKRAIVSANLNHWYESNDVRPADLARRIIEINPKYKPATIGALLSTMRTQKSGCPKDTLTDICKAMGKTKTYMLRDHGFKPFVPTTPKRKEKVNGQSKIVNGLGPNAQMIMSPDRPGVATVAIEWTTEVTRAAALMHALENILTENL